MSTLGRRTHRWGTNKDGESVCVRCGRLWPRRGEKAGNCSVPREILRDKALRMVKAAKKKTWLEAAEIAEAHGRVELARQYRALSEKEG